MARILDKHMGKNNQLWPMIDSGCVVHIKGRTDEGKSIVEDYGTTWRVKSVSGKNLLTFGTKNGKKLWINGPNDPNFFVSAVTNKGFTIGAT